MTDTYIRTQISDPEYWTVDILGSSDPERILRFSNTKGRDTANGRRGYKLELCFSMTACRELCITGHRNIGPSILTETHRTTHSRPTDYEEAISIYTDLYNNQGLTFLHHAEFVCEYVAWLYSWGIKT